MSTSAELLRSFLEYCSAECGLSINTLKAYEADVSNFLRSLKIKGDAALSRLSPSEILDYVDSCRRGGLTTNSVWRRLVAVRMFYRFLMLEGLVQSDPTEGCQTPRLWKRIPNFITV
jgi:site-specific recombinase XerD